MAVQKFWSHKLIRANQRRGTAGGCTARVEFGETKVAEFNGSALIDEEVTALDVAVNDFLAVQVDQTFGALGHPLQRLERRERLVHVVQVPVERALVAIIHDDA